jgi:hypothetical protein
MKPAELNIETLVRLYANGWSLRKIAREFKSSKLRVGEILRKNGIATRSKTEQTIENWRGHVGPAADGYLRQKINGKRKLFHRAIMESIIGRELSRDEIVHHRDGNKNNNSPCNLMITTRKEHPSLHG